MKTQLNFERPMDKCFLLILLMVIFYSCENKQNTKNEDGIVSQQTISDIESKENLSDKKQELAEEKGLKRITDSIKMDNVLQEVILIAKPKINKASYQETSEIFIDSLHMINTEINIGNFFSPEERHLIIRRKGLNSVFINIYLIRGSEIDEILEHEQWILEYESDTIKDVNGDNKNDFVVNWYGSSGCCLKAFSNVYLFDKNKKKFTKSFEFINPTFSPKEKIIRGVCYGHPGETKMYKYQWNGEEIDTIEYVFYETDDKGKKTGKITKYTSGNSKKIIINRIPKEYEEIYGFDWFTGNL